MVTKVNGSTKRVGLSPTMHNGFYGRDILSVKQFAREDLDYIFGVAEEMEAIVRRVGATDLLKGSILANLFYEPSTRTSSSFAAAMQRLGGSVIPINEVRYSSVTKGESLPDTIRTLEAYADLVVLRHPEVGASQTAARYSRKPIINAGDGVGEHPTQALLDIYTIQREKGRLEGLNVALVGDMNMRVMHSLPLGLAQFQCKVHIISPSDQSMPQHWLDEYKRVGLDYEEHTGIEDVLPKLDVIYLMGTKTPSFSEGRVEAGQKRESTPSAYIIDRDKLSRAKSDIILLHPLPRADELSKDVDSIASARYFVQAHYGVAVRMALLSLIMGCTL